MNLANPQHSVVAMYGFAASTQMVESFYKLVLGFFSKVNCRPSKLGLNSDKLRDFKRVDQKLRGDGFSNVASVDLYSIAESHRNELEGYNASCFFSSKDEICVADFSEVVIDLDKTGFLTFCQEIVNLIFPRYGIAYRRPFQLGPTYFALGLSRGPVSFEEQLLISQSFEAIRLKLHEQGVLRLLCPWNFLNPSHLSAKIQGQSLSDWIAHDKRRGTLTPFGNLTLWRINEAEIEKLQKPLSDARILFDYERDIVAKMDEFGVSQRTVGESLRTGQPLIRETHSMDVTASSPEEAMRLAMQAFGYTDPEEVDILKVEKPGELRQLSAEEARKLMRPQDPKKGKG